MTIREINAAIDELIEKHKVIEERMRELRQILHEEKMRTDPIYRAMDRLSKSIMNSLHGGGND